MARVADCQVCAKPVPGKPWYIATHSVFASKNYPGARHGWHLCDEGRSASAVILSYHSSRNAAVRARLAYRRAHPGARTWVGKEYQQTY